VTELPEEQASQTPIDKSSSHAIWKTDQKKRLNKIIRNTEPDAWKIHNAWIAGYELAILDVIKDMELLAVTKPDLDSCWEALEHKVQETLRSVKLAYIQ
jgi:hypothetical protein